MCIRLCILFPIVCLCYSSPTAEVLHELVSPNPQYIGNFGYSVSRAGDVNNDGHDDVLVGALHDSPGGSPFGAGRAYVINGATGEVLYELASPHEDTYGGFGCSVSGIADVNDDGYHDMVIGARGEEPPSGLSAAGQTYVFSGATGSLLYEFVSNNQEPGGQFGRSVSGAGDVNGDRYDDVIVGAPYEETSSGYSEAGRAYLFNGATGNLLYEVDSPNEENLGLFGCSVSPSWGQIFNV